MAQPTERSYAEALDASDPLAKYKGQFQISDPELCYLDGNSLGRLPLAAVAGVNDFLTNEWGRELVDGWVSLEVSPLLAHDTKSTIAEVKDLHARAQRPNLLIKIPGTKEGLPAIEEAIFAGVPVNVTLLFSDDQYLAAANAFMRGIERRIDAGLKPDIPSVASIFISRWDVAVAGKVPESYTSYLDPDALEGRSFGYLTSMVPTAAQNAADRPVIAWAGRSAASGRWTATGQAATGPLTAIDVAREICGTDTVNTLSICLGGTMNTMVLGYLDATGDDDVTGGRVRIGFEVAPFGQLAQRGVDRRDPRRRRRGCDIRRGRLAHSDRPARWRH